MFRVTDDDVTPTINTNGMSASVSVCATSFISHPPHVVQNDPDNILNINTYLSFTTINTSSTITTTSSSTTTSTTTNTRISSGTSSSAST